MRTFQIGVASCRRGLGAAAIQRAARADQAESLLISENRGLERRHKHLYPGSCCPYRTPVLAKSAVPGGRVVAMMEPLPSDWQNEWTRWRRRGHLQTRKPTRTLRAGKGSQEKTAFIVETGN